MEWSLSTGGTGRGVSTVIGVVLMVSIVVVLAAVVSVFALNFGGEVDERAPNIAVETSYNDVPTGDGEWLNMTVEAGDTIDTSLIQVRVSGATVAGNGNAAELKDADIIGNQAGDGLTAGETLSLSRDEFTDDSGTALSSSSDNVDLQDATVRIVWQIDSESPSQIIYECEVELPGCASE
jgi:FlaG/FlaF family flagellin (archaellin)